MESKFGAATGKLKFIVSFIFSHMLSFAHVYGSTKESENYRFLLKELHVFADLQELKSLLVVTYFSIKIHEIFTDATIHTITTNEYNMLHTQIEYCYFLLF